MADSVAIVSIVSGATVAIAVPFISATLERRRLRWQSETARLDELRALLDTSTVHLYEAWTVLYEIEQEAQKELGSPECSPKQPRDLADSLTAKFDEVMRDQLRVELRLPKGAVLAEKHRAMVSLLMKAEYVYRSYVEGGRLDQKRPPSLPSTGKGSVAIGEFVDEVRALVGATDEARRKQSSEPTRN